MEIGAVAMRFCNLQGDPLDPAAHEYAPSGKEERRGDPEPAGDRKRPALTQEKVMGNRKVHHGTWSIRRNTASTSPAGVENRPRSTVEKESRLSTRRLVQRPSISRSARVIQPPRRGHGR